MNHPLIMTERSQLLRVIDIVLTIIAWVGFLWLIYQGIALVLGAHTWTLIIGTLVFYALIALANSVLLILWARYNQARFREERRERREALSEGQLALRFGLIPDVLEKLYRAQIARVYYDEDGKELQVKVLQ